MKNNSLRRFWDQFLIFLIIQEVFVSFWEGIKVFKVAVLVLILITLLIRRVKVKNSSIIIGVGLTYFSLTLIQGAIWGYSLTSSINSFLLVFFQAYLIWLLYGVKIFYYFEKAFFVLTSIGFLIWIGINSSEALKELHFTLASSIGGASLDMYDRSILIFTHWPQIDDEVLGLSRFSGLFHEPGALAFFTVFMIIFRHSRIGKLDGQSFLYILFLVSSFSSAGYAALGVLLIGMIMNLRYAYLKVLMIFPILAGLYYSYSQIDFLQNKIETQVTQQSEMDLDEQTIGRVIGIRKAFYVIGKYPLHGRGLLTITQPASPSHPEYAKYGWPSFISKIGLIAGGTYLFFFITGLVKILRFNGRVNGLFITAAVLALFINLTAQAFIESIPMLLIFYYGLIKNNKYGR